MYLLLHNIKQLTYMFLQARFKDKGNEIAEDQFSQVHYSIK